ncbi:MAG: GerMN domain-containing protein [Limnochordia bacterium]|jgi:germination protein M|nr:GerMN domain-containing protein [Limnochordia bacterium]MDD4517738.1 GerMN domain-containing protein [Limnochordia bacterium]
MKRFIILAVGTLCIILAIWGIFRLVGPKEINIVLYFASLDGQHLVPVETKVPAVDLGQIVALLLAGPQEADVSATFPQGLSQPKVTLHDGLVYVDFQGDLLVGGLGGTSGETLAVYSLVNTLTQFAEVEAVQILIEGQPVDSLFGHLDTSGPFVADPSLVVGYDSTKNRID